MNGKDKTPSATYQPGVTLPQFPTLPTQPMYQQPTALMQSLDWLVSSPSIPLVMRRQFFMLWENVIFGNYEKIDIMYLMSKFREWCLMLLWYVPEQKWGNILQYQDAGDDNSKMEMDLNLLLNMLTQLYFINLTRGKDGFTVKEMTTSRTFSHFGVPTEEKSNKKVLRLF
jgi:hypothetical protein